MSNWEDVDGLDGSIGIPEESIIDTESSLSDGLGLGDLQESDGDHEQDEDYVMSGNGSASEEFDSVKPEISHTKFKKATQVRFFDLLDA